MPHYEVEESELDEMWSYVGKKKRQRWLWLAIDHKTRKIIAFVFGRRKHFVFAQMRKLLKPFGIRRCYSDAFDCYSKFLPKRQHTVGKENTQRIERKNLTLRTRIKRLARKTICFSKSIKMHDIVIGLVIIILDFGLVFGDHFHAFVP
jgi:insertion element IS1 protein InsB